jgi:hypothetical protein
MRHSFWEGLFCGFDAAQLLVGTLALVSVTVHTRAHRRRVLTFTTWFHYLLCVHLLYSHARSTYTLPHTAAPQQRMHQLCAYFTL